MFKSLMKFKELSWFDVKKININTGARTTLGLNSQLISSSNLKKVAKSKRFSAFLESTIILFGPDSTENLQLLIDNEISKKSKNNTLFGGKCDCTVEGGVFICD